MKILQSTQNQLAFLGISSKRQTNKRKIIFGSVLLGICIVLQCAAIFQPVNEFKEYIDHVDMSLTTIIVAIIFTVIIFSIRILFDFIDMFEKLINDSE